MKKLLTSLMFLTLLSQNVWAAESTIESSDSLFFEAVATGDVYTVKEFLDQKVDPNIYRNGKTALMIASENGHAKVVELLIEAGAHVNDQAAGHELWLLPEHRDGQETALILASGKGYQDVVKLLIEKDADVDASTTRGMTALMNAAQYGYLGIVKLLISAKARLDAQTKKGNTALMIAYLMKHQDIVDLLIQEGASLNINNTSNGTLLLMAIRADDLNFINVLIEKGANVNAQLIQDGSTALMAASAYDDAKLVELLIKAGAKPDIPDRQGRTALMWASIRGCHNIVKILIKEGADINTQDENGLTALILAAQEGKSEVVDVLIAENPKIDNVNWAGSTALMWASNNGYKNVVEKLIKARANLDSIDSTGQTAYTIAVDKGYTEIADLLINAGARKDLGGQYALKDEPIQKQSCVVTFEQDDDNDAIFNVVVRSLLDRCVIIASAHILNKFYVSGKFKFIQDMFKSGKLSLFLRPEKDLGIIIPDFINDIHRLRSEYGYQNVDYIKPENVPGELEKLTLEVKGEDLGVLIDHFDEIIDKTADLYPRRFYLKGHGLATQTRQANTIASMPVQFIGKFLQILNDNNAQLLYINSCYAGGPNLESVQLELQKIIDEQLHQYLLAAQQQYLRPERAKGVNYAIVIQATSDMPTISHKVGVGKFFDLLDKFLEKPLWAFGKTISKETINIADVINALGLFGGQSLPSIRFPGTISFFRSIDLKNMEIITWQKLGFLRLSKLKSASYSNLYAQKLVLEAELRNLKEQIQKESSAKLLSTTAQKEQELSNKIQALEAGMLRAKQIELPIARGIKYLLVYPLNLLDCLISIEDNVMPKFISKIPGQGQHFIGAIKYKSSQSTVEDAIDDVITNGFVNITSTDKPAAVFKCWFVKSLELYIAGQLQSIKDLVIKLEPGQEIYYGVSYAYKNQDGSYRKKIHEFVSESIERPEFEKLIHEWYNSTITSFDASYEATGGHEISYTDEEKKEVAQYFAPNVDVQAYSKEKRAKIMRKRILWDTKERISDELLRTFLAD